MGQMKKKREKKSQKVPTKTKTKSQKAPMGRRLVWRTAGAKGKLCSRRWRRIMLNNKWELYQFLGNKYYEHQTKLSTYTIFNSLYLNFDAFRIFGMKWWFVCHIINIIRGVIPDPKIKTMKQKFGSLMYCIVINLHLGSKFV